MTDHPNQPNDACQFWISFCLIVGLLSLGIYLAGRMGWN